MKRYLLFLVCLSAHAASVTSAATGDWDVGSTWVGGSVPAIDDTVILANGFTVTIPAGVAVTIGSSPANDSGTPAIQCSSTTGTGVLVVNGTLYFRGPVRECNATWTWGAGATIMHDSSQATTPSTANYTWQVGMANGQVGSKLVGGVSGTGARITVGTANANGTTCAAGGTCDSGQGGGIQGGSAAGNSYGYFQCYRCDISNWGTDTTALVKSIPTTGSTSEIRGIVIEESIIDHCGRFYIPSGFASNIYFSLYKTVIKNPVLPSNGRSIDIGSASGISTSVVCPTNGCRIVDSYIEGEVFIGAAGTVDPGFVFSNTLFMGNTAVDDAPLTINGRMGFADGNFQNVWLHNRIASSSNPGHMPGGTMRRLIMSGIFGTNPHYTFLNNITTLLDGFLIDLEVNNAGGDVFQITPTGGVAPYTVTLTHGIYRATPDGQSPGTAVNVNGNSPNCNGTTTFCPEIHWDNNTYATDGLNLPDGLTGEGTNGGFAGEYASVQNNIFYRGSSGAGYAIYWIATPLPVADTFTLVDYNWFWNITTTTPYYGYPTGNPTQYASAPGAHDQSGNPLFVDGSRTILTYGKIYFPSLTTYNQVADEFRKRFEDVINGGSTGNAHMNIPEMYDQIRAGFVPTNAALATAGSGGTYAGAMPLPVPFTGGSVISGNSKVSGVTVIK